MKSFEVIMLLSVLLSPVLSNAQEIHRATRSLEEQQADLTYRLRPSIIPAWH